MKARPSWPAVPPRIALAFISAGVSGGIMLAAWDGASAQQAATLSGPPQQVIPYASEPGVPAITITPGALNPFPTDGTGGTGGTGGNTGGSTALNTMENTNWGLQAIQNAQSLGVNPSALAATCVLESGCQNVSGGSGAQGVFQMYPAAYQEGLAAALAANPSLASQIVSGSAGMNDPTTEAIAASGYLMQADQALQSAGISNPTVLDARAYYNFGPTNGLQLAQADPSETVAQAMPNVSQATLARNGISAGETVGQWQASVSSKIGGAANQSVFI